MTVEQLEEGYWRAYRDFYSWSNIIKGASAKDTWIGRSRHIAYSAGWKKFERVWDAIINAHRLARALPALEGVLSGLGRVKPSLDREGSERRPLPVIVERPEDNEVVSVAIGARRVRSSSECQVVA